MSDPINDPDWWRRKLRYASRVGHLHHAIFKCSLAHWQKIEARHRQILKEVVKDGDSILDCGCGYGRLLDLMPVSWCGFYLGFDICQDFVMLAEEKHPDQIFLQADLDRMTCDVTFDIAVLVSVRPMVVNNLGQEAWERMEQRVKACSVRQLYLEYDPGDEGRLE